LLCVSAIEDDYTGPCLEDGKVTLDFAQKLMDTFRDQKKLHRKFAYQVNLLSLLIFLYYGDLDLTISVCTYEGLNSCVSNVTSNE